MKVRELIKLLKKMPQDLPVGLALFDNAEYEIAGFANSVNLFDKADPYCALPDYDSGADSKGYYDGQPDRVVVIKG